MDIAVENKDLEEFQETTGMTLADCIKILINSVKYGGKLEFDTFWSDANMERLSASIKEMNEGKCVKFTAEEWEKFVNEQELQ